MAQDKNWRLYAVGLTQCNRDPTGVRQQAEVCGRRKMNGGHEQMLAESSPPNRMHPPAVQPYRARA